MGTLHTKNFATDPASYAGCPNLKGAVIPYQISQVVEFWLQVRPPWLLQTFPFFLNSVLCEILCIFQGWNLFSKCPERLNLSFFPNSVHKQYSQFAGTNSADLRSA